MILSVTPTHACAQGRIPAQLYKALLELLRFRVDGYQHTWLFKRKRWDGWHKLHARRPEGLVFPAGLVHRVVAAAQELNNPITVERDELVLVPRLLPSPLPDGTILYEDQLHAIALAVQHQRGLWALAPNFGKTEAAAGLLRAFIDHRALYLVDGTKLLEQTAERLQERLREPVGQLGAGRRPRWTERVIVATVQTLRGRLGQPKELRFVEQVGVLIVDEVHVVTPTWFPLLAACSAPVRLGMSGTVPEARYPLVMEAYLGPVLLEVQERALVDQGRSADPLILMPYSGALVRGGLKWAELYEPAVVANGARSAMLMDAVRYLADRGLRSLVLYYRRDHGQALETLCRARGLRSVRLDGQSPLPAIKQATVDLDARRLDVILASTIANKGWDVPAFEAIVNTAAWESKTDTIQKMGRGMRRKEGLNRVVIVDPWDLGAPSLKKHSGTRERTYRKKGFLVHRGAWGDLAPLVDEMLVTK